MAKNDIGVLATKKQLSLANYTDRLVYLHLYLPYILRSSSLLEKFL